MGATPEERNVISGNQNWGLWIGGSDTSGIGPNGSGRSSAHTVLGNWIGIPLSGDQLVGNFWGGIAVEDSPNNRIGGASKGEGNVISGNFSHGIAVWQSTSDQNVILGNFIGLSPDGLSTRPTRSGSPSSWNGAGINIWGGASHNWIGGTVPGAGNFISGNEASGMTVSGSGTVGNLIQGNTFGLLVDGSEAGNALTGISVWGTARGNQIGGLLSGAGNTIAHHSDPAVFIRDPGTVDNPVLGNSIFGNALTGGEVSLDLQQSPGSGGPNPIDGLDGDEGPNRLQNFPTLTSAVLTGGGLTVDGNLMSAPNQIFRIEFFANPTAHPSGHGEGKHFLGVISSLATDGLGNATFSPTLPSWVEPGWTVTATATSSTLNTSEFSASVGVTADDADGDGMPKDYEEAHGLDLASDDANGDVDGDKISNIDEMRLGTDPNVFTDHPLAPQAENNGGEIRVVFPTVAGRRYRLDAREVLGAGGFWRTIADQILGNGGDVSIPDPDATGLARRFYQLVQLP